MNTYAKLIIAFGVAVGMVAIGVPATAGAETSGDGSKMNPYMMACQQGSGDYCAVTFPAKSVNGSDTVNLDFYRCPLEYPYLRARDYAPPLTIWALGVELIGAGFTANLVPIGNKFDDGMWSTGNWGREFPYTVTRWGFTSGEYQIRLHCTRNKYARYGPH